MDRRQFLKQAGGTLLVLPFGTFLIRCKEDDGGTGKSEADPTPPDAQPRALGSNTVFTSDAVEGHSHSFTVPTDGLSTPPVGGVFGFTTTAKDHSHKVEITEEALRRVSDGEVSKIVTSKDDDHTHTFTIVKV